MHRWTLYKKLCLETTGTRNYSNHTCFSKFGLFKGKGGLQSLSDAKLRFVGRPKLFSTNPELHKAELWKRLKTRIQILLTRKHRKWTRDDLWALLSWLFVGQGLFILVGTTTFASLVLFLANSLQVHDWLARKLTLYLAKHTGLDIGFGETIVPNWRSGKISFKKVSVKTIPTLETDSTSNSTSQARKSYTLYDLIIERAEVTLSMQRWLQGRGLVEDCELVGIRGIVDRRHFIPATNLLEKYKSQRGDFDLNHFSIRDLLVTVLGSAAAANDVSASKNVGFRPYSLSLISADFPRLRKRYLLLDILGAESMVGMLDGSLFSMHIPQITQAGHRVKCDFMRHLKMHSLNVDFFGGCGSNGGSPLDWFTRGSVDVDVFIKLPLLGSNQMTDKASANTLVQILQESGVAAIIENSREGIGELSEEGKQVGSELFRDLNCIVGPFWDRLRSRFSRDILNVDDAALEGPEEAALRFMKSSSDAVIFKVDFRFHNLRAHLPQSPKTSFVTTALMRPLVAYINEQRPFIPISCNFQIPLAKLDGAWTLYDSGIREALALGAAESFERLVSDRQKKMRRLKRISLWSIYAIFRNIRTNLFYHYPYISSSQLQSFT